MKDYSQQKFTNSRKYKTITYLPILLGLFYNSSGSTATPEPVRVVIEKNDSLSTIVSRTLKSANPELLELVAAFNNQSVDKILEIGDVIWIPGALVSPQVQLVKNKPQTQTEASSNVNLECSMQDVCWSIDKITPGLTTANTRKVESTHENSLKVPPKNPLTSQTAQPPDLNRATENRPNSRVIETTVAQNITPNGGKVKETHQTSNPSANSSRKIKPQPSAKVHPDQQQPVIKQESVAEQKQTEATRHIDTKPGLFEVDEDSAVRALERSLVQLNALLLKPGRAEVTFSIDYRYDIEFDPVLVNIGSPDDAITTQQAGQTQNQIESVTNVFDLKFGLPLDAQLSLSLPLTHTNQKFDVNLNGSPINDTQNDTQYGTGNLSITLTKTLAMEKGHRPDILLDATYTANTGSDAVGSGGEEFTFGLSATKRQDPLVFTGGFSHTISNGNDSDFTAGDVTQFSIGTLLAASPYTSLQFFLTQTFIEPATFSNQQLTNNRATIASFSAGVSSVIGKELFLNTRLGIGLVENATDFRLTFSIAKQFGL